MDSVHQPGTNYRALLDRRRSIKTSNSEERARHTAPSSMMKLPEAAECGSPPHVLWPKPTKTSSTLRVSSVYTIHGRSKRFSTGTHRLSFGDRPRPMPESATRNLPDFLGISSSVRPARPLVRWSSLNGGPPPTLIRRLTASSKPAITGRSVTGCRPSPNTLLANTTCLRLLGGFPIACAPSSPSADQQDGHGHTQQQKKPPQRAVAPSRRQVQDNYRPVKRQCRPEKDR